MKKIATLLLAMLLLITAGCGQTASTGGEDVPSTIDKILANKKIVIGTAPGYAPFEMKDKEGNFIGYDVDLGKAIAEALNVPVEFKQFEFSGIIPALQTGEIDMVISGMTIRGDRALSVSFSNPYYSTGQVLLVPASDTATKSWEDIDVKGKKIACSQGTTGALLAKQIYKNATVVDYPDFPTAGMALIQEQADAIVYDEPAIRTYEIMNEGKVRGVYDLISVENLGIAVQHNDLETVQWLNSFLESYRNSPKDLASIEKWFKSTDWMDNVANKE